MTKKSEGQKKISEWERLLSVQYIFQKSFPECILVGGTAASLHAEHRISMDADHVLYDLKKRFSEILKKVEMNAGWITNRIEPPVLILGHFEGVRTGIRQLIRRVPLETTTIRNIKVPTIEEMLRIKAYLIIKRNTTRDFIDFIALFYHIGINRALFALSSLDHIYPQKGDTLISQQLTIQLSEPKPWDIYASNLSNYKALEKPYTDWIEVKKRLLLAAQKIMIQLLNKKNL